MSLEVGTVYSSFYLISGRVLGQMNISEIWIIETESQTLIQFSELSHFANPMSFDWRGGWVMLRKEPPALPDLHSVLLPVFHKGTKDIVTRWLCRVEKEIFKLWRDHWKPILMDSNIRRPRTLRWSNSQRKGWWSLRDRVLA